MRNTFKALLTAATLAAGLIGASAALAQNQQNQAQPPAQDQSMAGMKQSEGEGMRHGEGMMGQSHDMPMMGCCGKGKPSQTSQQDQSATPQKQGG